MSLNTTFPDTEEDIRKERTKKIEPLLVLLKNKDPSSARTLADSLQSQDVPATSINSFAYEYIRDLIRENLEEASKIVAYFSETPYLWHCWLPKTNTTKFKKQPNYD